MTKFNIGDIICKDETSVPYTVTDIDEVSGPMPKYKLVQCDFSFWDYCIGWKKVVSPEEVLRYGVVLTDDEFAECDNLSLCYKYSRVLTISYDNHIYYYKKVNGEVVKFKELS